jgi:hypothetical protein
VGCDDLLDHLPVRVIGRVDQEAIATDRDADELGAERGLELGLQAVAPERFGDRRLKSG